MKKFLALLLALLMLGSCTAFAEGAKVFSISDPVIHVENETGPVDVDLAGLQLCFGPLPGEQQGLLLNIFGNDELLFRAQFRQDGQQLIFTADGLSHSYSLPVSGISGGAAASSPSFDVTPILDILTQEAQINYEADGIHFTLPYTGVLNVADELLNQLPAGSQESVQEARTKLAQMRETQSGPTISGILQPTDSGFHAEAGVYMVQNGVQAETAKFALRLNYSADETEGLFSGEMESEGKLVARLEGVSNTGAASSTVRATLSLDPDGTGQLQPTLVLDAESSVEDLDVVVSADVSGDGSFVPVATLDVHKGDPFTLALNVLDQVTVNMNKTGDTFNMDMNAMNSFALNVQAGKNDLNAVFSMPLSEGANPFPIANLSAHWDDAGVQAEVNAAGVFVLSFAYDKASHMMNLSGTITGTSFSVDARAESVEKELTACDGEGPVLSFNDLTDEEKEAMKNELVEGLTPVLQFISPALPA